MKEKKKEADETARPCLQHAKSLREAITTVLKIDMFKLRETLFIRKSILITLTIR